MNATSLNLDEDLPPSAGFVVWIIQNRDGSILRQDLVDETWLSERTVDRAVDRLEELGVVQRDRTGDDLRYVRISFVEEAAN